MNYLENQLREQFEVAEHVRAMEQARALAYYEGRKPEGLLVTKPKDPDDNMSVNYAELIVEKGVSFLFGEAVEIDIGDSANRFDENALEALWPAAERAEDLVDLATNGAIFGTAWLQIALDKGRPLVCVPDPLNMSAEWDASNYKKVTAYKNQYNTMVDGKPMIRRERTVRQPDGTWRIFYEQSQPDGKLWIEFAPAIDWGFQFAPVFHCKNLPKPNEFYGKPDLNKGVLELCKYIARVDSLINRIVRVHAYPKPVATGTTKTDLQVGVDSVLFLQNKDATLSLLEAKGDLAGAREFRKLLREALAEISHVPEVASGKLENVGQLSGLALKLLYGPLLDRTAKKQRAYGRLLTQVCEALLTIAKPGGTAPKIALSWPNPLPGDETAELKNKQTLRELGVSERQILSELGYTPEQIDAMQAENEAAAARASELQRQVFDAGFVPTATGA